MFDAEINDHGIHQGDTGGILALWRCPMASGVALDLPYLAMCTLLHRNIAMTIKTTSKGGVFFAIVNFLLCITIAERQSYGT